MLMLLVNGETGAGEKPPGAQIKRWYMVLIILIFLINISAIISLWLVQKALHDIVNHHEPLIKSAELINTEILEAQLYLSRYLSEDERDLTKAYGPLDFALGEADKSLLETRDSALRKNLEEIKVAVAKFKKALGELKAAKTGRNWRQVEEFRRAAVGLGKETQNLSQQVKSAVHEQIKVRNNTSLLTAKIVFILLLLLFLVSIAVIGAVLYWWRRFQDVLLEI